MFVVLKCISLHNADEAAVSSLIAALNKAVSQLPTIHSHLLQPTVQPGVNDGDIVWRICFATEVNYHACLLDPVWRRGVEPLLAETRIDSMAYEQGRHSAAFPNIKNGIWRALIFSIIEGTEMPKREKFEAEMLTMPGYVSTIRNWSLSRVLVSSGARRWSYVWEQDFDNMEAFSGEYMMNPIHWGSIDRWYDVENPDCIIDSYLINSVCLSAEGVIVPKPRK